MISWEVSLELCPDTYNGQPLVCAALAAQKNHTALYLNCIHASTERTQRLKNAYGAAGNKLDMGKRCIRIKNMGDVLEDVLGKATGSVAPEEFIAIAKTAKP